MTNNALIYKQNCFFFNFQTKQTQKSYFKTSGKFLTTDRTEILSIKNFRRKILSHP